MEHNHKTEHAGSSREPRPQDEASVHRDADDSDSDFDESIVSRAGAQFEERDLCSRLLSIINGRNRYDSEASSRALRQLLGRLIRIHPGDIDREIVNQLKSLRTGPHTVSEITAVGRKISEASAGSAGELWTLLRVCMSFSKYLRRITQN
jgi:hypothetical protein